MDGSFHPTLEVLEDRLTPYAISPFKWSDLSVSASFMPDRTQIGSFSSDLFAKYDSHYSRTVWQRQFARALQTWATVTPLDFRFVSDNGARSGADGPDQGSELFGDIRLGAYPSPGAYLAYAFTPFPGTTQGGDIVLNSQEVYNIGTSYDLYSILLHETGHALGLRHSEVYGAVMSPYIDRVYTGLTADDVAGIRAQYGARKPDAFESPLGNNSFARAVGIALDEAGSFSLPADMTSIVDVDFYKLTAPQGSDGTLTITIDSHNLSLLTPKLAVYSGSGRLLTNANAGIAYGASVTLTLKGLIAGRVYYIRADGVGANVFSIGRYRLSARFGRLAEALKYPENGVIIWCSNPSSLEGNFLPRAFLLQGAYRGDALMWIKTFKGIRVDIDSFDLYSLKEKEGKHVVLLQSFDDVASPGNERVGIPLFESDRETTALLAIQLIDEAMLRGDPFLDIKKEIKANATRIPEA